MVLCHVFVIISIKKNINFYIIALGKKFKRYHIKIANTHEIRENK